MAKKSIEKVKPISNPGIQPTYGEILDNLSDSSCCITESGEDIFDIVTLFHWNDSHLIFFINPNEEVWCFIVKDSTGIWPVTTTTLNFKDLKILHVTWVDCHIPAVGDTGKITCIYSYIKYSDKIHCSIVRYIESRKFAK